MWRNEYNLAAPEVLMEIIKTPSLRGIVYGYVAEYEFMRYLREVYVFAFLLGARASCSHRRDEDGTSSLPGVCVTPDVNSFAPLPCRIARISSGKRQPSARRAWRGRR